MNANLDDRPIRYDMREAHERARAGAETLASGAARRLTMAQAVAAKWIARYACADVDAVGRNVVNVVNADVIRH